MVTSFSNLKIFTFEEELSQSDIQRNCHCKAEKPLWKRFCFVTTVFPQQTLRAKQCSESNRMTLEQLNWMGLSIHLMTFSSSSCPLLIGPSQASWILFEIDILFDHRQITNPNWTTAVPDKRFLFLCYSHHLWSDLRLKDAMSLIPIFQSHTVSMKFIAAHLLTVLCQCFFPTWKWLSISFSLDYKRFSSLYGLFLQHQPHSMPVLAPKHQIDPISVFPLFVRIFENSVVQSLCRGSVSFFYIFTIH